MPSCLPLRFFVLLTALGRAKERLEMRIYELYAETGVMPVMPVMPVMRVSAAVEGTAIFSVSTLSLWSCL